MSSEEPDLADLTEDFAELIFTLLDGCLEGVPAIEVEHYDERSVIVPGGPEPDSAKVRGVPLNVDGETLAYLQVNVWCCMDHEGRWLAIYRSEFTITAKLDRTPIIRFEYRRDMHTSPCSHIQVHAHRGALSHLLTRTKYPKPHDMAALHIPTGGARFRPGLEDVLQFLIQDFGFDAKPTWQAAVADARAGFRRLQVKAAVRALPADAAAALRNIGYTVIEPEGGHRPDSPEALTAW